MQRGVNVITLQGAKEKKFGGSNKVNSRQIVRLGILDIPLFCTNNILVIFSLVK